MEKSSEGLHKWRFHYWTTSLDVHHSDVLCNMQNDATRHRKSMVKVSWQIMWCPFRYVYDCCLHYLSTRTKMLPLGKYQRHWRKQWRHIDVVYARHVSLSHQTCTEWKKITKLVESATCLSGRRIQNERMIEYYNIISVLYSCGCSHILLQIVDMHIMKYDRFNWLNRNMLKWSQNT